MFSANRPFRSLATALPAFTAARAKTTPSTIRRNEQHRRGGYEPAIIRPASACLWRLPREHVALELALAGRGARNRFVATKALHQGDEPNLKSRIARSLYFKFGSSPW